MSSMTRVCSRCGEVYFAVHGHSCARRLRLSDGYVKQQIRHLESEFGRPAGRHARPESGCTR